MRRPAWLAGLAAVLALLAVALPAAARPDPKLTPGADQARARSVSYSLWSINDRRLRLRFMLPKSQTGALVPPGQPRPHRSKIADAVLENLTVTSAAGPCYPIDQGEGFGEIYTMANTPGLERFEVVYDCPAMKGVVLHDKLLFKRLPGHINYARIQIDGGKPMLRTFTADQQAISIPDPGGKPRDEALLRHLEQGALRIVLHLDGLWLALGLLLTARRWKDLSAIAAALAGGYGLATAVSLTGLVAPDQGLADLATGLLLAVLGAGALRLNAAVEAPGKTIRLTGGIAAAAAVVLATAATALAVSIPGAVTVGGVGLAALAALWACGAQPQHRWLLLLAGTLFALLDGTGAGEALDLLGLTAAQRLPVVAGYSLGAIAAILALISVSMVILWLVRRQAGKYRNFAVDLGGAALVGAGVYWFVSRLYS